MRNGRLKDFEDLLIDCLSAETVLERRWHLSVMFNYVKEETKVKFNIFNVWLLYGALYGG